MSFHKHAKQRRPKKNLLIAGADAVAEAIGAGVEIERIFVQQNANPGSLLRLAKEKEIPVNKVPVEKLKGFNAGEHGGVVAIKSRISYHDLQDVISWVVERGETPLFVMLDGITDIRNIGAIARTAYSCGVDALIIPQRGVGALNEDAITTSAGALEQIHICRVRTLGEAVDLLQLNGIKVFASEMTAAENLFDADLTAPAAVIMGAEDKGIHPSLLKKCDAIFKIPMQNDFESLNVSVATGMILYEAMRQRINQ